MPFINGGELLSQVKHEISKVIVGQEGLIERLLTALLCRGHVLLVGPPGMAKTTLVHSFAQSLNLPFNRIQFTPDLMPSDILGTEILQDNRSSGQRELVFIKGPIFTQVLLADEINRTPPKTQAALLQAMQEKTVTIFGRTEKLVEPFMVLATQNPIEQEGTYPLPEAQLDRFLAKQYRTGVKVLDEANDHGMEQIRLVGTLPLAPGTRTWLAALETARRAVLRDGRDPTDAARDAIAVV